MHCPKCKTTELKKTAHKSPFFCKTCGGMWLVEGSTSELSDSPLEMVETIHTNAIHDEKTGMCPAGHGMMIRAKVDIDEPFYLERCTACGGVWFDKGEWHRIAANNLAENLPTIWSRSWQRKQHRERSRERFIETNKTLLGEDIVDAVIELAEKLKTHPQRDRAIALLHHEVVSPPRGRSDDR